LSGAESELPHLPAPRVSYRLGAKLRSLGGRQRRGHWRKETLHGRHFPAYLQTAEPFLFPTEAAVLGLILTFLLIAVALGVFFWAGTLWFQGYIYSEPAADLHWRAPAASAVLTLFFALWAYLEYHNPERYETVFNFSPEEVKTYPEFWTVKDGAKVRYTPARDARGRQLYLDAERNPPKTHPDAVIVKEEGREVEFKAERDAKCHFKIERGQSLNYVDDQGRGMSENALGILSTFRWGNFLRAWAVNLAHLAAWFVVLWLLLRFQWGHALGLALFFWLAVTLTIMPMLLARMRETAARTTAQAAARGMHGSKWAMRY
jgi:hypothetical protein